MDGQRFIIFKAGNMKILLHFPEEKKNALGHNQTNNKFNAQKIDKDLIFTDQFSL